MASFIKLPDLILCTGYNMRHSFATLLANTGADIRTVKRHGGCNLTSVAEGCIQDLEANKINIAQKIKGGNHQRI